MNEIKIYKYNLEKEVKDIREEIIDDCLKAKVERTGHNFEIFTKHHDKLYSLFKDKCKQSFKNYDIENHPTKLYCCFTDKDYNKGETWHNHQKTCTLCGVFYLKTIKGYGLALKYNDEHTYVEAKDFDLLIFPGFLDHKPIIPKTKTRISLQFEIFCTDNTIPPHLTHIR